MKTKSLLKTFLTSAKKNNVFRFIAVHILYLYLRLLFATYRLNILSDLPENQSCNDHEGIYYFWHQHLVAALFFFFSQRTVGHCLVSTSNDGKLIGSLAKKFGFKVLYKPKSPLSLIRQTLDVVEVNRRMCIIGDGSRGPIFQLQPFVAYVGAKQNIPLIFIECKVDWALTFTKSWNHFKLPLPFATITIRIHRPVHPTLHNYKHLSSASTKQCLHT